MLGDLRAVTVTPQVRQERDLRSERGALIYQIGPEAQRATGLRPGDVVFQINRFRVESAEDMQRAFRAAQGAGAITVWFERRGAVARTSFYVR